MSLATAGHLANAQPARPVDVEPLFENSTLSIATVLANVRHHGGDAGLFAERVNAGLASGQGQILDVVAIAAWRAGALGVRADALARLARIADAGGLPADAAASTLGIPASEVKGFVAKQRTNRWWRPGGSTINGYVGSVGGFEGLGGAWIAPPSRAVALEDDGAFAIESAQQWWRLDADVWCARLVAVSAPASAWLLTPEHDEPRLATHSWVKGVTVSLVHPRPTYLLWIHLEEK